MFFKVSFTVYLATIEGAMSAIYRASLDVEDHFSSTVHVFELLSVTRLCYWIVL